MPCRSSRAPGLLLAWPFRSSCPAAVLSVTRAWAVSFAVTCTQPDDSPGVVTGGSERSFHVSSRPRRSENDCLWCGFASTFAQTRSGTGDAHASGHDLPLFRPLGGSLVCCQQARLPTFPGTHILAT